MNAPSAHLRELHRGRRDPAGHAGLRFTAVDRDPRGAEDPPREAASKLPTFVQGRVLAQRFFVEEAFETTPRSAFYRAHDLEFERVVLLKLSPRLDGTDPGSDSPWFARRRPLTGARILGTVGEGVLPGGWPLLACQYWRGRSLEAFRRQGPGCLSLLDALEVGRDVALALEEAHARGHAHGRLCTDDVWLSRREGREQAMILGFEERSSEREHAPRVERDLMALGSLLRLLASLLPRLGLAGQAPPFDGERAQQALANVILSPLSRLASRQSPRTEGRPLDAAAMGQALERLASVARRLGT